MYQDRKNGVAKAKPRIPLETVLPKQNLLPVEGEELVNIFQLEASLTLYENESSHDWFLRTIESRAILDRFYNQQCFKRRRRDLKVDLTREKNHLLSMILMMSSRL